MSAWDAGQGFTVPDVRSLCLIQIKVRLTLWLGWPLVSVF